MNSPALRLAGKRIIICMGPGGVGKTTISAALAVHAAKESLAVDAVTIDPAPRLLDLLNLDPADAELQEVELDGSGGTAGKLRILRLDPKRTFDNLVGRHAPTRAAHDAILANRLYQNVSGALAGIGNYMAIEKLVELDSNRATDCIVLDTPPAQAALDFLDSPRRLLQLLDSPAARLLSASQALLGRPLAALDLVARAVLAAFDRLTGLRLLTDVQKFVGNFAGMYPGFVERAARAQTLLRDEQTLVIVVTTAAAPRLEETSGFIESLRSAGIEPGAVILNRTLPDMPKRSDLDKFDLTPELRQKLKQNLKDFGILKKHETVALRRLRRTLGSTTPVIAAPDLYPEPRTIADLDKIARSLALPIA